MKKNENTTEIVDVNEKLPLLKAFPLSLQHLFAMFGASVLVPILFGIDPAVVLFFNGIGTILYIVITKGKIPAYLGSSFAFLTPAFVLLDKHYGFEYVQGGFVISGLIFSCVALIIKFTGIGWIKKLFPAASMGAIVAIIGLELAPVAADMAGFPVGGSNTQSLNVTWVVVSMVTLFTVILCSVLCKGFLKIIPILIGVIVGYTCAYLLGLVNLKVVSEAGMFIVPELKLAKFDLTAILTILPATFVVIAEHIGHLAVTSSIMERDLAENPGLHRSLLGDGISTMLSGLFGSVPTTTYGENIGVMAITKVYSVYVIGGAAVLSIILGFSGKLAALIRSIPTPVIGGISLFLFGVIAASGFRTFIEENVDFSKSRNLILTAVTMIVGLSGITINFGSVPIKGMGLATIAAMVLSILFMIFDYFNLMNEE